MSRFRGDTIFGWFSRVLATFLGGILGAVMWYVTSHYLSVFEVDRSISLVGIYQLEQEMVMHMVSRQFVSFVFLSCFLLD